MHLFCAFCAFCGNPQIRGRDLPQKAQNPKGPAQLPTRPVVGRGCRIRLCGRWPMWPMWPLFGVSCSVAAASATDRQSDRRAFSGVT